MLLKQAPRPAPSTRIEGASALPRLSGLGSLLGVVGQEVVDHAVEQGGELVQRVRGPVRQGGLHAASAYLADAARRGGARWGERDELGPAVVRVGAAGGVAGLFQPLHLPGD